MKKNSVIPYNDEGLECLDFLIREEFDKVAISTSGRERLDALHKCRHEYEENIKIIFCNNGEILDEDGVDKLINHLQSLSHWAEDLGKIMATAEVSQLATYREHPYRVRRG